ncbi:MAG: hypothetical protein ABFS24_15000 [Pseudomonadota bacterium]
MATSLLSGCATDQVHSTAHHSAMSLNSADLENYGLAFITPSTVTGQEEDKQTLAFIFAEVMNEERPDIKVVSLPQTLSAINKAGFADNYIAMYVDYGDTGIFRQDMLKEVGKATGVRYLAQLKLSNFSQQSRGRFSALGIRLIQTKEANIRMFFQIWDSVDGSIVWEGTEEVTYAWESGSAEPVTFRIIVEETAQNLISLLP